MNAANFRLQIQSAAPVSCNFARCLPQSMSSPKDVLIMIDTSGSVIGLTLNLIRHSVRHLMSTLTENDYFNIFVFNEKASFLDSSCPGLIQAVPRWKEVGSFFCRKSWTLLASAFQARSSSSGAANKFYLVPGPCCTDLAKSWEEILALGRLRVIKFGTLCRMLGHPCCRMNRSSAQLLAVVGEHSYRATGCPLQENRFQPIHKNYIIMTMSDIIAN